MWTDGNGYFYQGDCRVGDRAATQQEIDAYNAQKAADAAQAAADAKDITKTGKLQKAFALWVAGKLGVQPNQAKSEITAIYDSLP